MRSGGHSAISYHLVEPLLDQFGILLHLRCHLLLFRLGALAEESLALSYHPFELFVHLQQHHDFLWVDTCASGNTPNTRFHFLVCLEVS